MGLNRGLVLAIVTGTFGILELSRRNPPLEELVKLGVGSAGDVGNPEVDEDAADDPDAKEHVAGLGSDGRQLVRNDDVGQGTDDGVGTHRQGCRLCAKPGGSRFTRVGPSAKAD